MKFGVLGTGMVGNGIRAKLAALGHEVKIGSREAENAAGAACAHPNRRKFSVVSVS